MWNSPSFVLPGVSKCCVSPNCGLPLLTTPPQCAVSSTHFAMVVKATRAGILWNWDLLKLWVFTIDLAEENYFHIANNSNLQVGSYFYDRNSVTCTSEFRDPKQSRESTERALQHSVKFRNLPKAQRIVRWQQRLINRVQQKNYQNGISRTGWLQAIMPPVGSRSYFRGSTSHWSIKYQQSTSRRGRQ